MTLYQRRILREFNAKKRRSKRDLLGSIIAFLRRIKQQCLVALS